MKCYKFISAILLAAVMLTGCDNPQEPLDSLESSVEQSTETISTTISSVSESTSTEDNSSDSSLPEENSAAEIKEEHLTETEQIVKLLGDYGAFYNDYFNVYNARHLTDEKQYITEERTVPEGKYNAGYSYTEYYYKVTQGNIITYTQLTEKLKEMLTENAFENTAMYNFNFLYKVKDDSFYLNSGIGQGGFLGYDYLYLNSIDNPDEETIILNMTALGEKEAWGYDEDETMDFQIVIKRTADGLRIDELDPIFAELCVAHFSCVIYNDVSLKLNNYSNFVTELHNIEKPLTETEQILKLIADYSNFYFEMTPFLYDNYFIDKTKKITVDGINDFDGVSYTIDYYKTVNLPANTISELNDKLDGFVTENLKNEVIKGLTNSTYIIAENGDLYMIYYGYTRGAYLGSDIIYLDSVEHPDENTILINLTSFGDKDNWETSKDFVDKYSVKIVRTENGLRIDECDNSVPALFEMYDEIIYGDISLSI